MERKDGRGLRLEIPKLGKAGVLMEAAVVRAFQSYGLAGLLLMGINNTSVWQLLRQRRLSYPASSAALPSP